METQRGQSTCTRCGVPAGVDDVVVTSGPTDPLQVTECGTCGAVLDVGGHPW